MNNEQIEKAIDLVMAEEESPVSARSLMKQLTDLLKPLGFKVVDREVTAGAIKAWLDSSTPFSMERWNEVFNILSNQGLGVKMAGEEFNYSISSKGFTVEPQGRRSAFIAVYAGPQSDEYKHGLDV